MRSREQIGSFGLISLIYLFLVGSAVILPVGVQAGRSAWLAILLAGVLGFVALRVYVLLGTLCSGQSFIRYTQTLLGKWPGRLVSLLYLWYALHLGALVLRNFVDFLMFTILPRTSTGILALAVVAVCAYGVRLGLEPLVRVAQVLAVFLTVQVIVVTRLVSPHIQLGNLLPLLEPGIGVLARTTFSVFAFPFGEVVLFVLFLHQVDRSEPVWRWARLGMTLSLAILALGTARNISVLGANAMQTSQYPNHWVLQAIDIAEFLTRMDAFLVGGWIGLCFAKVSVCLYAATSGLADWAGLRSYQPLVLPVATWMAALSLLIYRNVGEQLRFAAEIWPVYSLPFQVIVPLVLLVMAWWRKARAQGGG